MAALGRQLAITAATFLWLCTAHAQLSVASDDVWSGPLSMRPALGIDPGKAQIALGCGSSIAPCNGVPSYAAAAGNLRWSVEIGTLNLANARSAFVNRQGLNLSLVGRRSVSLFGSNLSFYGKLGTTYGMAEAASIAPAPATPYDAGTGLSFGAGVSMEVTPRLSATLGWDSYETRFGGPARDLVRATSLGLQYRY